MELPCRSDQTGKLKNYVSLASCYGVQSFPIGKDGKVMIDGLDLFDPAQPFWDGKVPPILWPRD